MAKKNQIQSVKSFMEIVRASGNKSPYVIADELKVSNGIRLGAALKKLGYVDNPGKNLWRWTGPQEIADSDAFKVFTFAQQRGERKEKPVQANGADESYCIEFLKARGYEIFRVKREQV